MIDPVTMWFQAGGLAVMAAVGTGVGSLSRKVMRRLDRDESLRADYPPHRHINGKISYPKEYQPAPTEELNPERQ